MKKIKRIIKSIRLYFATRRFARHYAELVMLIRQALGDEEGGDSDGT